MHKHSNGVTSELLILSALALSSRTWSNEYQKNCTTHLPFPRPLNLASGKRASELLVLLILALFDEDGGTQ
jgi:hypothetical protein